MTFCGFVSVVVCSGRLQSGGGIEQALHVVTAESADLFPIFLKIILLVD